MDYVVKTGSDDQRPVKDILIRIQENTRYLVGDTSIKGLMALDEKAVSPHLNTRGKGLFYDGPFVENMPESDRRTLENIYRNQGFENAQVSAEVIWTEPDEKNQKIADVVFEVTEGYRRHVMDVVFEGLPDNIDSKAFHQVIKTRKTILSAVPGG